MDISILAVKALNLAHALKIVDSAGNIQYWVWGTLAIAASIVLLTHALQGKQPTPRIIIVSSGDFNVKEVK